MDTQPYTNPRADKKYGLFSKDSFEKYLVFKLENGSSFLDINAFDVMRDLKRVCGSAPRVVPQADGSLMVEANSAEESAKLKKIESLASCPVTVKRHDTLNQTRGVVYCKEYSKYSEEVFLNGLREYGVVRVDRIRKKVDGALVETPTLILTFDRLSLPDKLLVGYYSLKVRPYIPRPRRCFHCQRFGHVGRSCRRQQQGLPQICVQCGQEAHGENVNCTNAPSCVNCQGAHPASSTQCDFYRFESEVLAVRTRERMSFKEAKERVRGMFVRPGVSFATVLTRRRNVRPQEPQSGPTHKAAPCGGDATHPLSKGPQSSGDGRPHQRTPALGSEAGPSVKVGAESKDSMGPPHGSLGPDPHTREEPEHFLPNKISQEVRAVPRGTATDLPTNSKNSKLADEQSVKTLSHSISQSVKPSPPLGGEWQVTGESKKRKQQASSSSSSIQIQKKPAYTVPKQSSVTKLSGVKPKTPSPSKVREGVGHSTKKSSQNR